MIGFAACAGVLACAGWTCLRSRRHRMREALAEAAGDLHARSMRVQASARDAMSCIHWIGSLPDVAAAAVRSELREVRSLAARANGISRAAADVMEACGLAEVQGVASRLRTKARAAGQEAGAADADADGNPAGARAGRPGPGTRQRLMESCTQKLSSSGLNFHIHHLRQRLGRHAIQTVRGGGFQLLAEPGEPEARGS